MSDLTFVYNVQAHPTKYNGVLFRSRLEARWAAFFDLVRWRWDYEPIDLVGWTPDFWLRASAGNYVLVEVKPVHVPTISEARANWEKAVLKRGPDPDREVELSVFAKARAYREEHVILCLGVDPRLAHPKVPIGRILGPGDEELPSVSLVVKDREEHWREAGNAVRWKGRRYSSRSVYDE